MLKVEYEVSGPTFKYVESMWFRYKKMVKRLEELEKNIYIPSSMDMNSGIRGSGRVSNPVENEVLNADRIVNQRQVEQLQRNIYAIETVYNQLPDEYKTLVRERYWSTTKKDWNYIADKIQYSKSHAYKIRKAIIVATAEMLGLW